MNRVARNQGFTLIELMLAMSFVSVLLLAIAMTVIQVGATYSQGMMLKEVNQTSRDISNDLTRTIGNQGGLELDTDYYEMVDGGLPIGGRLCLGTVSYIWNYGEALQTNHDDLTKTAAGDPVRIAKVVDPNKKYCATASGALTVRTILASDASLTSELLKEGDRTLEVYQFEIIKEPTATDDITGQQLYTIVYTIGSGKYTALNDTRTACKAPGEPDADPRYCTVEQFSLTLRTGGEKNE